MINKLSCCLAKHTCNSNNFDEEIIAYGYEVIISTMLNLLSLFFISYILGYIKEMVIFILFFSTLRVSAGGHHAKNYLSCFFQSFIISYSAIYLANLIQDEFSVFYIMVTGLVSIITIFKFAPVESLQDPLNCNEKTVIKKRSRMTIIFLFTICIAFSSFEKFAVLASTAIFTESLNVIFVILKTKIIKEGSTYGF